jgi:predicted nuclease of predicted toxin-antitoxin system
MAALLADENFPFPVVQELQKLGHDVKVWSETGLANIRYPDFQVIQVATEERRALLTINRKDFIRLHTESAEHEGILVCTQDMDFSGQAQRIHEAIQSDEPLKGKLLRVNRPSSGPKSREEDL